MKNVLLLNLVLFGLSFFASAQNRFYVNATATGGNTGQSWGDAFIELQTAIQSAQAGDEIWVSKNTYRPTTTTDRDVSFEPLSGVRLYGGFAGNEDNISQRNWALNPTILSGDIGQSNDSTDNSYNVVYLFEPDSNTVIDGFLIRDGNANNINSSDPRGRLRSGGGLYIMGESADAYPEIRNCTFEHNVAFSFGAGVLVNGANNGSVAPKFVNCRFEKNNTKGSGGGIARIGGSAVERGVEFQACVFLQNHAEARGGGLYYSDGPGVGQLNIGSCVFEQNVGTKGGGGAYLVLGRTGGAECVFRASSFHQNVSGGAAAIQTAPSGLAAAKFFEIDSCTFTDNKFVYTPTSISPSVVWIDLISQLGSLCKVSNTRFEDNKSWATIITMDWIEFTFCQIRNSSFVRNEAFSIISLSTLKNIDIQSTVIRENTNLDGGTLIQLGSNKSKLTNLLVDYNSVQRSYIDVLSQDTLIIENSIFTKNNIAQTDSYLSANPKYLGITNSAFSDINNRLKFFNAIEKTDLDYSYFDTLECSYLQTFNITCGPNNLYSLDPQFRDPANHDYSLLPCSPLINAGSNLAAANIPTDLAGNPRIQGGTVDIGAFESPSFTLASAPSIKPACVGAANGSISLDPVFGCEPYIYQWLPQVGNGPELDGLAPGTYQLTLTDGRGQQILDTFQVAAAALPALSPIATDVQCSTGLGGSISAGVTQGTAPYQMQWSPAAADTTFLGQLAPGSYALTVTDANGCQDSASTSIALLGMITLMVDGQPISCFGESDGWLSATPVTGAAPFNWAWSGWSGMDSLAQPLSPGQYAVTVSDTYGCTAFFSFPPMSAPDSLVVGTGSNAQSQSNPPNGAAVVTTISGGTSPYDYQWNTGGMSQAIAGLVAGLYTVTVTDDRGCTASATVEVQWMVGTQQAWQKGLLMYPNPTADWVQLSLPEGLGSCQWTLSDASGSALRQGALKPGDTMQRIDLQGFPSGVYWLKVEDQVSGLVLTGRVMRR